MPELPDGHAIAAIVLTVSALWAYTRPNWSLELTSLGLLAVLAFAAAAFPHPNLHPQDYFAGFGNEALIAVCALMVLGQGLVRTGALEPVGRTLGRFWRKAPFLTFLLTLVVAATLSAFVNNTPIVVLLLPILVSVCLKADDSPARVLMPMNFATIVGGAITTIGTSTNLLVVGVAEKLGMERLGMFDFVLPASIAAGVAILYLWLIAPLLLPRRDIGLERQSPRVYEARLQLRPDSPACGKTLEQAIAMTNGEMKVVRVRREGTFILPLPEVVLQAGDRLRVRDTPMQLKSFEDVLKADLFTGDILVDEEHPLQAENQMLAEIAVVQGSTLDRANLGFAKFVDTHQLVVLALHRAGKDIWRASEEIQDVILQHGDVLLVQGPGEQIASLRQSTEFLVLDGTIDLPTTQKAPAAFATLLGVVLVAAFGLLPISTAALFGGLVLLATRTLTIQEAMSAVSTSVYFVIVASLALGHMLFATGATEWITQIFLWATAGAGPMGVLASLMLMLALLTNVVSNNAAAVIGTPIAIGIAAQLNLPPEPFVLAVLFGANMSYCTPMAYQTNLLVMNAANYTFAEFMKVGVPLMVLMLVSLTWALGAIYF